MSSGSKWCCQPWRINRGAWFGFVHLCRHISSEVTFESVVFKKKYLLSEIYGTNNIKGERKKASTERVEKMDL